MAGALKMGFIGAGQVAREIHLPLLSQMPQVEPLVLCDVHEAALDGAFRKFGIRETTTRYQDVLKMTEVDAVLIAVPNYLHARIAEEALRAGKHVLCEKPSALTVRDAMAVKQAAEASGAVYMMALPHRFDAEAALLKRWIGAGHLGRIFHVRAGAMRRDACPGGWFTDRERSGGGALMQVGSNLLDLLLWLLDFPEVGRVSASISNHLAPARAGEPTRSLAMPRARGLVYDVEDAAFCMLRLNGHASVVLEVAWSLHCDADRDYLEIYGDRAGAALWPLRLFQDMDGVHVDVSPHPQTPPAYPALARHFVECVLASERGQAVSPRGNAQDGLRLTHLLHHLYLSAEAEREVDVVDAAALTPPRKGESIA